MTGQEHLHEVRGQGTQHVDVGSPEPLRIAVLGPVRAWRGDTALDLGPVRRQAVLVALLLGQSALTSHDQLLDGVWGSEPPASKVLPTHVNSLRRVLDPAGTRHTESVIRSGKGWYRFVLDRVRLDTTDLAERGEEALRTKATGQLALAAEQLTGALALFQGEPLAGLSGPFALAERERLTERRRALRQERLECLVLLGRFRETLDDLAEASMADPVADLYDESLLALRIRALYGCERQAEALRAYEDMRVRLRDELGVDPGEELRRVHEAVLRQDDTALLGTPARPRIAVLNELPGDGGRLVGREAELAQLTAPAAPGSVSVVTVDGPAGVGKSALVVRAARELSAGYPDGCLFVDLRAHSTQQRQSPERALQRLLRSLGAAKGELPSDLDELTAAWRAATSALRLLLVLDDALDAEQIRPLLPSGGGSRVLVAGRRRLTELDADRRVTLEPLAHGDAVSLIAHLIGAERADREPEAARRLAGLCDGLPLALRIAGSRLQNRRAWTVEYLVGRMTGDERRLGELSVGNRSVEAAFRLSYDHLAPEQQRAFRVLGLAPTVEFDVLTPAAMLGRPARETERLLESLVDTSLVQEPRPGRYRLHDLMRVHARRVAEAEPEEAAGARRAALRLFLDAARVASDWGEVAFPTGPRPTAGFGDWREAEAWLDAAGGELPDVVAYAVESGEIDHACWIAHALCDYFVRQGRYHESQTALETAFARVAEADDAHMTTGLRGCLAYTYVYQHRYHQSRALFTECLRLSRQHGRRIDEARALTGLGSVALSVGEADEAISHVTEGVALSRSLGDEWASAMARLVQGRAHQIAGRDEAALACFAAACTHAEAGGRQHVLGRVLSLAADAHLRLGRDGEARHLLRQAVQLSGQCGDVFFCARGLTRLGTVAQGEGDPRAALAFHRLALELHDSLSRVTEPAYDWLEMDIRTRLAHAQLATGSVREAHRQYQRVLDVYEARRRRRAQGLRPTPQ